MQIRPMWRAAAIAASAAVVLGGATLASAATAQPRSTSENHPGGIKHVLLISVDGLHQQDLTWYILNNPKSVLATLAHHGVEYSNAETPFPSDSSPGMVAQVTGGDPRVTGYYYDDTWNHDVFPAGTTKCTGPVPGAEAAYEEAIDKNSNSIDAGQGLSGLPGSILQMTGNTLDVINPANLPVDPVTCKPIFANQYLKVNTIFNVARNHGLRTAWSDKHPAYQMFSGPSGNGVQDYFTPEINSIANTATGADWTTDNALTMQYDSYKVQAILNEIDGFDHSGFSTDDDGMLLWLSDRSQAAADFVKNYLLTHSAAGNNINGNAVTVSASGLKAVYAGAASAAFFGVPNGDPRHPDVLGIAQHGVVYTGGKAKIAEHGGDDRQDRNVPILVALPGFSGVTIGAPVETTEIAPTILRLLGLNPGELQAVQIEHTKVLRRRPATM